MDNNVNNKLNSDNVIPHSVPNTPNIGIGINNNQLNIHGLEQPMVSNGVQSNPAKGMPSVSVAPPPQEVIPTQSVAPVTQNMTLQSAAHSVPNAPNSGIGINNNQPNIHGLEQPMASNTLETNQVKEAPGVNSKLDDSNNQSTNRSFQEKKPINKKVVIIGLTLMVIMALAVVIFFLLSPKETKQTDKPKEPVITEPDWDPATSKITMSASATKLECSLDETFNGMTNKITYTHLYEGDVYTQVVVEDEIVFNEDTIQYYDYYVGSAEEEIEYELQLYDNIVMEVREKKSSVSLAYSFDLTASQDNPKNMLDDKELSKDDMKLKMENMGFICK